MNRVIDICREIASEEKKHELAIKNSTEEYPTFTVDEYLKRHTKERRHNEIIFSSI